jgi:hypothetical protein
MLRFDQDALFDAENTPAPARRRSVRVRSTLSSPSPPNQAVEQIFPRWARKPMGARDPTFFAGAGLALLDTVLRDDPPFAGALRQRLALGAAVSCAKMARLREDASGLRDAEHLASVGAQTSPAGRMHRLWRLTGEELVGLLQGKTPVRKDAPPHRNRHRGRRRLRLAAVC